MKEARYTYQYTNPSSDRSTDTIPESCPLRFSIQKPGAAGARDPTDKRTGHLADLQLISWARTVLRSSRIKTFTHLLPHSNVIALN